MDGWPEPTLEEAQEAVSACQAAKATMIVALGGGSVMDVAKLASVLGDDSVSLEQLMSKPALGKKSAFVVMMPTTARTGAEATPNAIVIVPERQFKVGIVNSAMIADAVLLAPLWMRSIPQRIAASAGVDALAHAIECFTSKQEPSFASTYIHFNA